MRDKVNDGARLSLMLESITNIAGFMEGVESLEEFKSDKMLCHAVVYNLQCIGEGAYMGMRALSGRLIDTKDETKYNISRDSAGNLLIQKTNSRKYDLAGAGTVTSEDIQVGRIKARRDVATYGFGGFFSVSGGSTVIR